MGDKTMSEHEEILFNLFILEFFGESFKYRQVYMSDKDNEFAYNYLIQKEWFENCKNAFPESETCHYLISTNTMVNYIAE